MTKALVLFAGIGGSSLGLKNAGYKTLSVEIDKDFADIHKKNIGECQAVDVLQINPVHIRYGFGVPEIFWLSPPCQAYSRASIGKGKNTSKNRIDKDILLELINANWFTVLKSPYIVLENVPEYRKSESFKVWCSHLSGLGYSIRYNILNAYDFGVPTRRLRLIAIATQREHLKPIIECSYTKVGWFEAIKDLIPSMADSELTTAQKSWLETQEPFSQPFLIERVGYYNGNPKIAMPDEPIWTIKKSIGTDGKNGNRGKFINVVTGNTVKDLSVQALGVLQGFPVDYCWGYSERVSVCGIGNAVVPVVAQLIGKSIKKVVTHTIG